MYLRAGSWSSVWRRRYALIQRRWRSDALNHTRTHDIRNVGIIAHIDAGKTTTTERMLYYSGVTRRLGDVDRGNTVTDYMDQERERGISITSAVVSFPWNKYRINLIDTPGHVDFVFEVDRTLKVLDGAVVILDGSAGVEAQTVQVWKQANRCNIPRITFVNKLDKPDSSLSSCVASMESQLKTNALVLQLPVGLHRIIDLVTMEMLVWEPGSDGRQYTRIPLVTNLSEMHSSGWEVEPGLLEAAVRERGNLVEQVMMLDTDLLAEVLTDSFNPETLSPHKLRRAIRSLTLSCEAVPVVCGSSLKNIGVQPLLSAITHYLPTPLETKVNVPSALSDLYAHVFKVTHDSRRHPLVFLRLYAGHIKAGTTVYNFRMGANERVSHLYEIMADETHRVQEISEGNIVVAVGLKKTSTGDVLVRSSSAAKKANVLATDLEVPAPVFFCSIEPASLSQQKELEEALNCLSLEDPSLRVSTNSETGQTILSGMGELHLEVIHHRLKNEFKLDCSLGKLQVAYRECPTVAVAMSGSLQRSLAGKMHTVDVSLHVEPVETGVRLVETGVRLVETDIRLVIHPPVDTLVEDAVRTGVHNACAQGPLLAFPVQGLSVQVTDLVIGRDTSLPMVSACISDTVTKALKSAHVQLLEPFANLEVCVQTIELVGLVLSDITNLRRGQIQNVAHDDDGQLIFALVPMSSLTGYSTALRTITSGSATFTATYSHHVPVPRTIEENIIAQVKGYIM